jgi:monomeric sarcosine oxidase
MYDVIILGGGVVGASVACALGRRRRRTLMLEQYTPAHDRGSSHGDGRMIRFDYSEAVYVEMVDRAFAAWAALADRIGEPVLRRTGLCNFGPANSPHLAALETSLGTFGLPFERLTARESNARFPQYRLDAGSETLYQPDAGVLFADRIVRALWRCAREDGVEAVEGVRVTDIEASPDRVILRGDAGQAWTGSHLVLAAGGWSERWLDRLGLDLPLEVTQEQVAYFPVRGNADHTAGAMPNAIDYHTPQPFYCVPQVEVPGVKAGWHHTGPGIDPDRPQPMDEANFAAVQDFIRRRCPGLDPAPVFRQRCLYTNSPDYHFILDRHPHYPHIAIAAGFSGHGFKFGPVLGEMLAALLYDEPPPVDRTLFSIRRFEHPGLLKRRTIA